MALPAILAGTECTGKAGIMKKFVVVVDVFISRSQSQKTLFKHQSREYSVLRLNDTAQDVLGSLKEVETASDMSDRKKAGR